MGAKGKDGTPAKQRCHKHRACAPSPGSGGRMAGRTVVSVAVAHRAGIARPWDRPHAPYRGAPHAGDRSECFSMLKELIRRRSRSRYFSLAWSCTACSRPRSPSRRRCATRRASRSIGQCRSGGAEGAGHLSLRVVKHAGKLGGIPGRRSRSETPVEIATGVLELWATSVRGMDRRSHRSRPEDQHRTGPSWERDCCNLADHEVGGRYLNEETITPVSSRNRMPKSTGWGWAGRSPWGASRSPWSAR